ncbi:MAG: ABC transporter substrate-binding protein [Candidatus Sumerlaeaceae bacterium]
MDAKLDIPPLRRGLVLGLAAICLALALAGCSTEKAGKRKVVRMWTFPMLPELRDREMYELLVRDFEKEQPGIKVQIETLPWAGRIQKMITAAAGNRTPDAVYLNLDLVARLVSEKLLRPIDDNMTSEDRADYDPAVMDGITLNGHQWVFPILRTVTTSLYNKDLFAAAGLDPERPPATWQELDVAAHRLTQDHNGDGHPDQWGVGYVFGGDTLNLTFWPLLWQAGGEVLSPDGRRVAFDSSAGMDALKFIVGLFKDGCIPGSYLADVPGQEFPSGKLGYFMGVGPLEIQQLRRDAPKLRFGVAPILKYKQRASYGSIGGFGIFAASRHPEETVLWLRFLTRTDNMKRFCRTTGFLPPRRSVGALYSDDPLLSALEKEAQFCRPDVKSVYARQIMQALAPEIQQAALGKKTEEQAIRDGAAAANEFLIADQKK